MFGGIRIYKQQVRKWSIIFLLASPLILFVGMRVSWWCISEKALSVLVIDKTNREYPDRNNKPFFWVMNRDRYVRRNGLQYDGQKDFIGLVPLKNGQYNVRDFRDLSEETILHIASRVDIAYYIGSYGVSVKANGHPGWWNGGMTSKDMVLLRKMKKDGKLVIVEYNVSKSPGSLAVRNGFENEFGVRWSGWIGRYFPTLDTVRSDLPPWVYRNYMKQHDGVWPFKREAGVVFAQENGKIGILREKKDFVNATPLICTFRYGTTRLGMQKKIEYHGWFEISQITDTSNHAVSIYELRVNARGKQKLEKAGIPSVFPAVIRHNGKGYGFYYLCGNFNNDKVPYNPSYFVGGEHLALMLNGRPDKLFFYRFYYPMMTGILRHL